MNEIKRITPKYIVDNALAKDPFREDYTIDVKRLKDRHGTLEYNIQSVQRIATEDFTKTAPKPSELISRHLSPDTAPKS